MRADRFYDYLFFVFYDAVNQSDVCSEPASPFSCKPAVKRMCAVYSARVFFQVV